MMAFQLRQLETADQLGNSTREGQTIVAITIEAKITTRPQKKFTTQSRTIDGTSVAATKTTSTDEETTIEDPRISQSNAGR